MRYNEVVMNFRRMTAARAVIATVSTCIEETGIWAIWRFLLPALDVNLSVTVLIVAMVLWLLFSIWLFTFTTFFLRRQKPVGPPTMIGTVGFAASDLAPGGMVRIKSELWSATTEDGAIRNGEPVIVVGEKRMKLTVRRRETGITR